MRVGAGGGFGVSLALALVACTPSTTELVVVVDTDLEVPAEVDRIEVTIAGPSGRSTVSASDLGPGASLPSSVGLVPERGAALSPVVITVVALHQGRTRVSRVVETGFVAGARRLVPLFLQRACEGHPCPTGETCIAGVCATRLVRPEELPAFDGLVTRLDGGGSFDGAVDAPTSVDDATGVDQPRDAIDAGDAGDVGDAPARADLSPDAPSDAPSDAPRPTDLGSVRDDGRPDSTLVTDTADAGTADAGGCDGDRPCPSNLTCCGGSCVDLRRDLAHCSACGRACGVAPGSIPRCVDGRCDYSCTPGHGDCDGAATNGCEARLDTLDHCGACGRSCALTHATSACSAGACAIARCAEGYGDCDGDPTNGCEAPLDTTRDCGACGRACPAGAHATSSCAATCVVRCEAGFGDCDGDAADGCETDLRTGTAHCGRCGAACAPGASCSAGICSDVAVTQLTAGRTHACALRSDRTVVCWGSNGGGALGDGTTDARANPVRVAGLADVVEVDAGSEHTCARRADGSVWCWGIGDQGALGNGRFTPIQPAPVRVGDLADAQGISCGGGFSCARSTSRGAVCWGANTNGELGDGTLLNRGVPVVVAAPVGATALGLPSAGQGGHACASRPGTREVYCWGKNLYGQLGNNLTSAPMPTPATTEPYDALDQVTTGGFHTCSRVASHQIFCWGANGAGQLGGAGTLDRYPSPRVVLLGTDDVEQIALGGAFSCVLRTGGRVTCWGTNGRGQLGDGTTTRRQVPRDVGGLLDAVEAVAGEDFACARRATGAVVCWGANGDGQLGDGTTTDRTRLVYSLGLP
ncbi:MAG: hypothetical protein Q8S73_20280 [Deltaproteobacteria bacterium]|nr:hypothetical protein [Myxococcales bacterium]MDP3216457.1 hypothetical protein [Deltaproteobacteria bacterium]